MEAVEANKETTKSRFDYYGVYYKKERLGPQIYSEEEALAKVICSLSTYYYFFLGDTAAKCHNFV